MIGVITTVAVAFLLYDYRAIENAIVCGLSFLVTVVGIALLASGSNIQCWFALAGCTFTKDEVGTETAKLVDATTDGRDHPLIQGTLEQDVENLMHATEVIIEVAEMMYPELNAKVSAKGQVEGGPDEKAAQLNIDSYEPVVFEC